MGRAALQEAPSEVMLVKGELREKSIPILGKFRVVPDAVVGGGFDLRAGQIVAANDLGVYFFALMDAGALVRVSEDLAAYVV